MLQLKEANRRPLAELQNLKVFFLPHKVQLMCPLPSSLAFSLSLCSPLLCCLSSLPLGWLNCPDYLLCHFTFRKSRLELARRPVEGGSTYQPPPLSPLCASPPCCCPAAVLLLNLQLLGLCRTGSVKELS